jgi:hypothetical protein
MSNNLISFLKNKGIVVGNVDFLNVLFSDVKVSANAFKFRLTFSESGFKKLFSRECGIVFFTIFNKDKKILITPKFSVSEKIDSETAGYDIEYPIKELYKIGFNPIFNKIDAVIVREHKQRACIFVTLRNT